MKDSLESPAQHPHKDRILVQGPHTRAHLHNPPGKEITVSG